MSERFAWTWLDYHDLCREAGVEPVLCRCGPCCGDGDDDVVDVTDEPTPEASDALRAPA